MIQTSTTIGRTVFRSYAGTHSEQLPSPLRWRLEERCKNTLAKNRRGIKDQIKPLIIYFNKS
jgi:hypothetical protein